MALRKEIRLCDTCNDRISTKRCDCCNGDMCNSCIAFNQTLRINSQELVTLSYCQNCKTKYIKSSSLGSPIFDENFKKKIGNELKEYIKGRALAEAL